MNRRLVLGTASLVVLLLSAGCLGAVMGPQDVSDERLNEPPAAAYEWDSDRDAHITVTENASFAAVYDVNETEVQLFRRDGLGGRNAISVSALQYRYENGTVVGGTEFRERGGTVKQTNDAVTVTLPQDARDSPGELAFTSSSTPKRFALPTFVKGSYEVVLPPDRRIDFFLFGQVRPTYTERTVDDQSRTHVLWDDVQSDSILVQFYLQRDLTIFGGIAAVGVVVAVAGLFYYKRQIEALEDQRRDMGLNVDIEDDDDGPPPGMR
ncbi:hypothetical protein SAMN04487948_10513 [Halogranum amylolyticum]|uniref:Lipoprotein n=1 Tax=Halogranum amylolyticum TaxID=660520 RepID=A0A1H8SE88_9EURY|nr:DUF5803 family protein [Halogranum amylolyticum]SEO76816.1 hypothetical protein SAMN04487948_10513 [Halogranum amylolyticum]